MAEFLHSDAIGGEPYDQGWVTANATDEALAQSRHVEPAPGNGTPPPGPQTQTGAASDMRGITRLAEAGTEPRVPVPNERHCNDDGRPNFSPDAGYITPTSSIFLNTYHPFAPRAMGPSEGMPGPPSMAYTELVGPEQGGTRRRRVTETTPRAASQHRRRLFGRP